MKLHTLKEEGLLNKGAGKQLEYADSRLTNAIKIMAACPAINEDVEPNPQGWKDWEHRQHAREMVKYEIREAVRNLLEAVQIIDETNIKHPPQGRGNGEEEEDR